MRQQDERDLRTALREEAERHRPDRQAMLDRINHGRAAYARTPRSRFAALLRPAAAAVAVAVVLVLAVAGVQLANRGPGADDAPVAGPSVAATTPAPTTTAVPKPSTAVTTTSRPSSRPPTGTTPPSKLPPSATSPAGPDPEVDRDGYVASTGQVDPNSNDHWSQGTVVVESTRVLTALEVSVEIALTPGVVETGRWTSAPTNQLAMTSSRTNKKLTFDFTLQQGTTLAAGKYTFAVQFNHDGKRSVADDSYVARVTGEGKDAKVSGGFTR